MSNKIIIVGCGPSLRDFNFSKLHGKSTIAVNHAIRFFKPTYFLSADSGIIKQSVIQNFWGQSDTIKIAVIKEDHRAWLSVKPYLQLYDKVIKPTRIDGVISFDNSEFATCRNSGFCAIQFAILSGFTTIFLFGFDLVKYKGQKHFYDVKFNSALGIEHDDEMSDFYQRFITAFQILKNTNIKVFSCSPFSLLNSVIPKIGFEEALELVSSL